MRLIMYDNREKAQQIVKQYQYASLQKLIDELNKVSIEIQKEDLDYKAVYGVLDKVVRDQRKVYDFIQGTISRIQPLYKFVPYSTMSTQEPYLGEYVFFDTYINNDEDRGHPTGYYKIDDLILMEGGY